MTDDLIETLDLYDLSSILKKTAASIRTDLCRSPHRLPPRLYVPGSAKVLWLKKDVLEWLEGCKTPTPRSPKPVPPRRGRPTKSEQIQRRAAATLEAPLHA